MIVYWNPRSRILICRKEISEIGRLKNAYKFSYFKNKSVSYLCHSVTCNILVLYLIIVIRLRANKKKICNQ